MLMFTKLITALSVRWYTLWGFFFLVSFALSFSKVFFPDTSPWDEQAHLSHVQYVFQGIIPVDGMAIGSWAKQAYSCHIGTLTTIPCGEIADARWYPMGGTNSSAFWQPTYFVLAAIFGAPFVWSGIDPLYSIRIATAIVWAAGVAWLGFIASRRTRHFSSGLLVVLALTAIPLMGYMSSAVTPHSLNPLLAALALTTAFKWFDLPEKTFSTSASTWRPLAFVGVTLVGAWSIPQSLTIFGTVALFIALARVNKFTKNPPAAFREGAIMVANIVTVGVSFVLSMNVWAAIQTSRAIAPVSEVDVTKSPGSALDVSYENPFVQAFTRWASFWPNGIRAGWAQDDALTLFTELAWVCAVLGLTIAAFIWLRKPLWAFLLVFSVVIVAPVSSIAYDYYFPSDVPVRYGLGIPVIGLFAVMSLKKPRWVNASLLVLACVTYVLGFFVEPMFPFDRGCSMSPEGMVLCLVGS